MIFFSKRGDFKPTDITFPDQNRMVNVVVTREDGTVPTRDPRDPRPRFIQVSPEKYHPSVQPNYRAFVARKLARF